MNNTELAELQKKIRRMRLQALKMIYEAQSGHPGGSMSLGEILGVLYFDILRVDPKKPDWELRDRLILSKGHGAPMLYATLCEKGYFDASCTASFRKTGGLLQGHPVPCVPGVDSTSGSLGFGLPVGLGMALGLKFLEIPANVYVVLGDGELNEGSVWEAVMAARQFGADNLIAIIDNNKYQNDGACSDVMCLDPIAPKWSSFGWEAEECDGHDIMRLSTILGKYAALRNGRPKVLVAHTIKGYGVGYLMQNYKTHYSPPTQEQFEAATKELTEKISS